jgi:predicted amidohydrolase
MQKENLLKVGLAQISPIWLNKEKTIDKIISYISEAGNKKCELVIFGEALLPGYPFGSGLLMGLRGIPAFKKRFMPITSGILYRLKRANLMVYARLHHNIIQLFTLA